MEKTDSHQRLETEAAQLKNQVAEFQRQAKESWEKLQQGHAGTHGEDRLPPAPRNGGGAAEEPGGRVPAPGEGELGKAPARPRGNSWRRPTPTSASKRRRRS